MQVAIKKYILMEMRGSKMIEASRDDKHPPNERIYPARVIDLLAVLARA